MTSRKARRGFEREIAASSSLRLPLLLKTLELLIGRPFPSDVGDAQLDRPGRACSSTIRLRWRALFGFWIAVDCSLVAQSMVACGRGPSIQPLCSCCWAGSPFALVGLVSLGGSVYIGTKSSWLAWIPGSQRESRRTKNPHTPGRRFDQSHSN